MDEMNDIRQEAAAIVINECKEWLSQIMADEMERIREDIKQITVSRLKIEQIATAFEEDAKKKSEESTRVVAEISGSSDKE